MSFSYVGPFATNYCVTIELIQIIHSFLQSWYIQSLVKSQLFFQASYQLHDSGQKTLTQAVEM